MRLADESQNEVETFLRAHFAEPDLRLPPIKVHAGRVAALILKMNGMGAITFGRHIFMSPARVRRDAEGRLLVPGWLLVHEAAHVRQYRRAGFFGFLFRYARGYLRALRKFGCRSAQARRSAYHAIPEEEEAHDAERAYAEMRSNAGPPAH